MPPRAAVEARVLNPKSLDLSELYGCCNPATNEWKDGLASSIVRDAVAAAARGAARGEEGLQEWVVFDGPVDAVWIESMNTGGRSDGMLWGSTFTARTFPRQPCSHLVNHTTIWPTAHCTCRVPSSTGNGAIVLSLHSQASSLRSTRIPLLPAHTLCPLAPSCPWHPHMHPVHSPDFPLCSLGRQLHALPAQRRAHPARRGTHAHAV